MPAFSKISSEGPDKNGPARNIGRLKMIRLDRYPD